MADKTSLLLSYLRRPNPDVDSTWSLTDNKAGSKRNASGSPHDDYLLRGVLKWEDMDWKDLKPMFEGVLAFSTGTAPNFEDALADPSHLNEISDENSLDALLISWNYPVVRTALSVAQGHARFQDTIDASKHPHKVSMARGGQAWLPDAPKLAPDWAGILLSCDDNNVPNKDKNARHYLNVLPGDTKLSTKFKSEWGWDDQRFKAPIIQVFTYCRRARVPYGYIITQEELVIIHLFYGDRKDPNKLTEGSRRSHYLEYKSIPWANRMDNDLTINLTLWCLHMLAARRKPISGRKELDSEYPTPAKSIKGGSVEFWSSESRFSDHSSKEDRKEFSFYKRKRSDETESEDSRGIVKKRRSKRYKRNQVS